MCISKVLSVVRETLNAESTTGMVGCIGPWHSCTGADVIRVAYSVRALTGNISVIPVIQFAEVRTDRPGDWATITGANARTSNGDSIIEATLTGSTESPGNFYFRTGLQYTENAGAGHADCRVITTYKCLGEVVANTTVDLEVTTTTTQYRAIGGKLPAVGVTAAKAAFLLTGAANVEYSLAYRTFSADDEEGSAWTTIGTMHNPTSDDYDEYLMSDTSFGTGLDDKLYYQLGIAYDAGSASQAYGTLTVMAAVRGS